MSFCRCVGEAFGLSMVCRTDGTLAKGAGKLTVSVLGGEDGGALFSASRKVGVM